MKTKIVTWLGNGEERIDFEGDAVRVTVDGDFGDDSLDQTHIQSIYLREDNVHIIVGPVGTEFDIIGVTPHGIGLMLMITNGPSRNVGKRPVYQASGKYKEPSKLVRYV